MDINANDSCKYAPINPKPWQFIVAAVLALAASFISWRGDELARKLLADGETIDGTVMEIRHVSESKSCQIFYSFTTPDGKFVADSASIGKPYYRPIKEQFKKDRQRTQVEVLWQDGTGHMLKVDAIERIQNTWGWPKYIMVFVAIGTCVFVLLLAITTYLGKKEEED